MPRKKEMPPINVVEQGFMAAIDRLLQGMPENKALQKKAHQGSVQIDKRAVALEAGHSRTTLYKYPKVIARIDALAKGPATTAQDVIAGLRAENRAIRQERQQAIDYPAAILLRMRELERSTATAVRKAEREARRPDPLKVVGVSNVVSLPGKTDGSSNPSSPLSSPCWSHTWKHVWPRLTL